MANGKEQANVVPFQDRSVAYTVNGQEVKLTPSMVRQYLVTGNRDLVTDQEIVYFMNICRSRGLNPFNKDCYLIKYTANESAAIIVSIEKLRMVARKSDDCEGWEKGIIVLKPNGELRYSKGLILEGEKLLGGYFKAQPKGWKVPFEIEVNLSGYIKKTRDGNNTRFWSVENQPTMIAKVAEAQGLRTVWPEETKGLYVAEEIREQEPIDVDFSSAQTGGSIPTDFDTMAQERSLSWPNEAWDKFVANTANGNNLTVDKFKQKVIAEGRFADLWAAYERSFENKPPADQQPYDKKTPPPAGTEGPAWERKKWIMLRGAGYGKYVLHHLDEFKNAPDELLLEARGKWVNVYKNEEPWPLDKPDTAPKTIHEDNYPEDDGGTLNASEIESLQGKGQEETELQALKEEYIDLASSFQAATEEAKKRTGIASPQTIDGYVELIRAIHLVRQEKK